MVTFDFQSSLKRSQRVRLFCLLTDDNSVVDFPDWQKAVIYLSAARSMQIVAVLPNCNIAYVNHDQILQQLSTGATTIHLNTKKQSIKDYLGRLVTF